MTIGKSHGELKVTVDNEELEQVTEFVYLGGLLTLKMANAVQT